LTPEKPETIIARNLLTSILSTKKPHNPETLKLRILEILKSKNPDTYSLEYMHLGYA
jgi:hypothetical protein